MGQSWLKIDRRLHDHWKVRSIAEELGVGRRLVVGCLCYLWGLAEDVSPCLGPRFRELDHELPEGLLQSMAQVGWATLGEEGWELTIRASAPKSERMSELARRSWDARRNADAMRTQCGPQCGPMRTHAERERERKKGAAATTDPDGSSPPLSSGPDRAAMLAALRATLNGAASA